MNGYLLFKKGQTIGKVVVKKRIVDLNGNYLVLVNSFFVILDLSFDCIDPNYRRFRGFGVASQVFSHLL